MKDLKVVVADKIHETIFGYIKEHVVVIGDYEDMKECILNMVRSGHCFAMDRDRLRDAMEDITYMCSPEDDANRDRVCKSLEYDDESDEDFDNEFGCGTDRRESCPLGSCPLKTSDAETPKEPEPSQPKEPEPSQPKPEASEEEVGESA